MDQKKIIVANFLLMGIYGLLGILLILAFWGGVALVAWHFVSKFW